MRAGSSLGFKKSFRLLIRWLTYSPYSFHEDLFSTQNFCSLIFKSLLCAFSAAHKFFINFFCWPWPGLLWSDGAFFVSRLPYRIFFRVNQNWIRYLDDKKKNLLRTNISEGLGYSIEYFIGIIKTKSPGNRKYVHAQTYLCLTCE